VTEPDVAELPSLAELPLPPARMRALVGETNPTSYDNPDGAPLFPYMDDAQYEAVLDFGCGCGRLARQFIQQRPRPKRYIGVDLHAGMIAWCNENLAPAAEGFEFHHHDIRNAGLNPGADKPSVLPLPAEDDSVTLAVGWSVFTHILEVEAEHYLHEISRVLRPGGRFTGTFFLFEKAAFPMLQDFQNALYINPDDPTNAVIFDRDWLRRAAQRAGLVIARAEPPDVRGFHWRIDLAPPGPGVTEVELQADEAAFGAVPPPLMPVAAHRIGVDPGDDGDERDGEEAAAAAGDGATTGSADAVAQAREASRQWKRAEDATREAVAQRERAEARERELAQLRADHEAMRRDLNPLETGLLMKIARRVRWLVRRGR